MLYHCVSIFRSGSIIVKADVTYPRVLNIEEQATALQGMQESIFTGYTITVPNFKETVDNITYISQSGTQQTSRFVLLMLKMSYLKHGFIIIYSSYLNSQQ